MLDVGCGTGQAIFRFGLGNPEARQIIGIDHSESMLAVAKRKLQAHSGDRIDLVKTDVIEWLGKAESEPFDLITAIGFLHHLSDEGVAEALSMMALRTRPGGRLLVAEPMVDPSISEPRLIRLWNRFSLARRVDYSSPAQEPEERPLPRALLYEAFASAGLEIRSHASSWEIFNWTTRPGWIERRLIRLLFRVGGPGIVNAWCLKPAVPDNTRT